MDLLPPLNEGGLESESQRILHLIMENTGQRLHSETIINPSKKQDNGFNCDINILLFFQFNYNNVTKKSLS